MRFKIIIIAIVILIGTGVFFFEDGISKPDMNDPVIQNLVEQLESEGYQVLTVTATWLGRIKVEAHSETNEREIVVAPGAGTILRDDISPLEEDDIDDD